MSRLEAREIAVSFGVREALGGVGLAVGAGETVGLIGPNGAGKTTLLRVCAGLLPPGSGTVLFEEKPITDWKPRERARRIALLPVGAPYHWPLEVRRLVALGRLPRLGPWQRAGDDDEAAIDRALTAADATPFVGRAVGELSNGERARVMLARALAGEPDLLLADEPVSGLDPAHQLRVMEVLAGLAACGGSVVVTLHDLTLAMRFCDRVVMLDRGRVAADGPPAEVLTPESLEAVFGLRAVTGRHEGVPFVVPWTASRRPGP